MCCLWWLGLPMPARVTLLCTGHPGAASLLVAPWLILVLPTPVKETGPELWGFQGELPRWRWW